MSSDLESCRFPYRSRGHAPARASVPAAGLCWTLLGPGFEPARTWHTSCHSCFFHRSGSQEGRRSASIAAGFLGLQQAPHSCQLTSLFSDTLGQPAPNAIVSCRGSSCCLSHGTLFDPRQRGGKEHSRSAQDEPRRPGLASLLSAAGIADLSSNMVLDPGRLLREGPMEAEARAARTVRRSGGTRAFSAIAKLWRSKYVAAHCCWQEAEPEAQSGKPVPPGFEQLREMPGRASGGRIDLRCCLAGCPCRWLVALGSLMGCLGLCDCCSACGAGESVKGGAISVAYRQQLALLVTAYYQ